MLQTHDIPSRYLGVTRRITVWTEPRARERAADPYPVLYLNDGWQPSDGGALRLHLDDGGTLDVAPAGGTLVAFLSEAFEHALRPATRTRRALTGWFRRRAAERRRGGTAC